MTPERQKILSHVISFTYLNPLGKAVYWNSCSGVQWSELSGTHSRATAVYNNWEIYAKRATTTAPSIVGEAYKWTDVTVDELIKVQLAKLWNGHPVGIFLQPPRVLETAWFLSQPACNKLVSYLNVYHRERNTIDEETHLLMVNMLTLLEGYTPGFGSLWGHANPQPKFPILHRYSEKGERLT